MQSNTRIWIVLQTSLVQGKIKRNQSMLVTDSVLPLLSKKNFLKEIELNEGFLVKSGL